MCKQKEIKREIMLRLVTRQSQRSIKTHERFSNPVVKKDNHRETKQEEITRAHIPIKPERGDKVNARLPTCLQPFEVLSAHARAHKHTRV